MLKMNKKSLGQFLLCTFMIICALQIDFLFNKGVAHNMDQVVPEAIEDNAWAIAAALSDMVYGLHKGYMYYTRVFEVLNEEGMTKYPYHLKNLALPYPQNLESGKMMNHALHAAMVIPNIDENPASGKRKVMAIPATDLGVIDYFKLGFHLFGFHIVSAYYLFFLILVLTIGVFFVEFCNRPLYLLFPACFLGVMSIVVDIIITLKGGNYINTATLYNNRVLSILAILPGFHLLLLMLDHSLMNKRRFILAVFQCAVLTFIVTIRSSTMWIVLELFTGGILYGILMYFKDPLRRASEWRDLLRPFLHLWAFLLILMSFKVLYNQLYIRIYNLTHEQFWGLGSAAFSAVILGGGVYSLYNHKLILSLSSIFSSLKQVVVWPILLMASIFFCYNTYHAWVLHPIYSSEICLPHHMRYHNGFIGLSLHPKFYPWFLENFTKDSFNNNFMGDDMAYNASFHEIRKAYASQGKVFTPQKFVSSYTGTYRMGLHEFFIRKAFFRFIKTYPRYTLQLVWGKFKTLWEIWYKNVSSHFVFKRLAMLSFFLIPLGVIGLRRQWWQHREVRSVIIAAFSMGVFAHLVPLYVYPALASMDQVLSLSIMVLLTIPFILVQLLHWLSDKILSFSKNLQAGSRF